MIYGPCGGVRDDLTCEMQTRRCPFADLHAAVAFDPTLHGVSGPRPIEGSSQSALLPPAATRQLVLTDLTLRPFDVQNLQDVVSILVDATDAVLVGEHQNRPDFPPTVMAQLIALAGARAWVTLTCRDRNRLVLEQEIAGLQQVGVDAILCVTGDGRAPGIRPGVTQVFDLDGTRLAALVAHAGLTAAVAESPQAEPVGLRPERLRQKQRAGASICVLNHVRSVEGVRSFISRARSAGVTVPFIASVAVYTDDRSALTLQRFPGLHIDDRRVAEVLGSADPVGAGVRAAVAEAAELLEVDGVGGVNISGLASSRSETFAAEVKAMVGREILQAIS